MQICNTELSYEIKGKNNLQMEGNMLTPRAIQTFQRKLIQVQNLLDQNRILINEITQNHESKIADNLTRNINLIQRLNINILKVSNFYVELFSHCNESMGSTTQAKSTCNGVQ